MSTELYLDTARLGRMCRGARTAEREYGWLVGQLGSSLYLERFLTHGFGELPKRIRRRLSRLICWPGVAGLAEALGQYIGQPAGLPTHFFGQSSSLIRFAAKCLFAKAKRVLATDLAWPAYLHYLQQQAMESCGTLRIVPIRAKVLSDGITADELSDHLCDVYAQQACDGLFLSDISYLGIRLPIDDLLKRVELAGTSFVAIDGAQALRHRNVNLSRLECDLYLAGTQKWLGAYHPLRLAIVGRSRNLSIIDQVRSEWLAGGHTCDALFEFCCAIQGGQFEAFGETVHVSPLITAAGALRQARRAGNSSHDAWQLLLANARILTRWLDDQVWHPTQRHASLASGIVLMTASNGAQERLAPSLRAALAQARVVASVFPEGLLRLSMPRYHLCMQQRSVIARALLKSRE